MPESPSPVVSPPPSPQSHESAPIQAAISPRSAFVVMFVIVFITIALAAFGILQRMHHDTALAARTNDLAAPTVLVANPPPGAPVTSFVLPGNVTAFTDSPIYARTSGYLLHWYFDIGARVKSGALLAEISTPEIDQQLRQAEADLATAQANANIARVQAERYTDLVKSDAVSHQDTDTFVSQASATAAAVRSAQANVQRLRDLQAFEKVYAPFNGVITSRNVDIGQLIDPGAGKELFHLQAVQTLRVYTNVPQFYAQSVKPGSTIDLTFAEHPGKTYQGTLVRTSDAIDPVSRTLLVEIDVPNRTGELMPGSLAQVHFKTPPVGPTYVVPVAAVLFRKEGLRVVTVVNGDQAHLVQVKIGEDDGARVQIITGIGPGDQVIQDPPDSIVEGEKVRVVTSTSPAPGGK